MIVGRLWNHSRFLFLKKMSRYYSYLNSAIAILKQYDGIEPFAAFIKKHFSVNKKFGSKDRKTITNLCYCYFRLGNALQSIPLDEKILVALFLCSSSSDKLLEELKPEWNKKVSLALFEKRDFLSWQFIDKDIFLWKEEISEAIDKSAFIFSHLSQPDLFLRLRSGKEVAVITKLDKENIPYTVISSTCLALPNSSKIDKVIELNEEAVIQDRSSQRVAELLQLVRQRSSGQIKIWDCCAASGGKSLLAKDVIGKIDLTVSDIRESILANLKKRFAEAGIKKYKSLVADLTKPNAGFLNQQFDLVIADVPCSGSGTWGRTPEQLCYFDEKKIKDYTTLQSRIIDTVTTHLKPGGHLLYITCSVFKKENEVQATYIKQKFHLNEVKMEWLRGYDKKADTMFAVLFQKPLV